MYHEKPSYGHSVYQIYKLYDGFKSTTQVHKDRKQGSVHAHTVTGQSDSLREPTAWCTDPLKECLACFYCKDAVNLL